MLVSLLLMFSQYKFNWVFKILFFLYILLIYSNNFSVFLGINILCFLLVTIICYFTSKTIPKLNLLLSAISILLYSVIIDIICYFLYSEFSMGQNLIFYIINGVIFNCKYVVVNMIILYLVNKIYTWFTLCKKLKINHIKTIKI